MYNVVFDLDDTLWDLNKRACNITGINFNKLTTFLLSENPNLSTREKEKLLSIYQNPMLWADIEWSKGAKSIKDLENYGAKVYINSNCMNKAVADYKRGFLSKELGLPNNQIILNVSTATEKPMLDNMFIFVDDSPFNLKKSTAEFTMTIDKPWNRDICVNRFNNIEEIIKKCKALLNLFTERNLIQ